MSLPIRAKLTIWYTVLVAVSLIIFGIILYAALSKSLTTSIDNRLLPFAGMISKAVFKPGTVALPQNFDVLLEHFFGIKTTGTFIQLLDKSGKIVFTSSTLGKTHIPLSGQAYHHAIAGNITYETIENIGRYPARIITFPLMDKHTVVGILQIGAPLQEAVNVINTLFYVLAVVIPFAVILGGIAGWFFSKKVLGQVDDITSMAKKIEAGSLNERLNVSGPKDELGRLAETFNDMIARLELSFKQQKQFTADASHELKTPLTVLKGEMEIALKTEKTVEGLQEAIRSNLEEVNKMSAIVRNLLDLARIDSRIKLPKDKVSLNEIMEKIFNQTMQLAKYKGVDMKIIKNEEVVVVGDILRIGQLVFNLIDNAIKYTVKDGKIEISLEQEGDWAIITVLDTGIGIAQEDIPYIFDRFYRVDKARTSVEGGVGLGLSICKEIVDAQDGRIEVESAVGKGSIFRVYLPVSNKTNELLGELGFI
ncbi:MAG: HAMP domain-containing protein [Deltaproteobacteria bacterium]|nr:HAMP domain-containing protein [Deltaproteobacteria bacterium]